MKQHPARHDRHSRVQGEGDYDAARRFDKAERAFVSSGKVRDAARRAQPRDAEEAEELARAEAIGRSHAKDEDPAVRRPDTHGL
jgi:hypothetical protein